MTGTSDVGDEAARRETSTVDLYWIPLGAGTPVVRVCGRVFEAISAVVGRRPRGELFHAALEIRPPGTRFVVEQAPVRDDRGAERGVVAEGPVGMRWAGHFRVFRYEVRCWEGGQVPDLAEAVGGPVSLSDDAEVAQRIVEVLPLIPTPVWGRDELGAGEMWNSNSVVAWALERSGIDLTAVHPPPFGRAPGWAAGRAIAARSAVTTTAGSRPGGREPWPAGALDRRRAR